MYRYTNPTIKIYITDVDIDDISICHCDIWQKGATTSICGYYGDSTAPSGYTLMTKDTTNSCFSYQPSTANTGSLDASEDLEIQVRIKTTDNREIASKKYHAKVDDVLKGSAL